MCPLCNEPSLMLVVLIFKFSADGTISRDYVGLGLKTQRDNTIQTNEYTATEAAMLLEITYSLFRVFSFDFLFPPLP